MPIYPVDPEDKALSLVRLQQRTTEVGRIRIGKKVPTKDGKTRPAKLDTFRLTSPSKAYLDRAAALYGGVVEPWRTPQGHNQWQLETTVDRIPVYVPQQAVTQWFELWSTGGCERRCNGQTELLQDTPCRCLAEGELSCKPTTRLNVLLADVGVGVWLLTSTGWNMAAEMPAMADLIARASTYVPADMVLEPRAVKHPGQPVSQFAVVVLEPHPDLTVRQLLGGQAGVPALTAGGTPPAVEAHAGTDWAGLVAAASTVEQVKDLWRRMKLAGESTPVLEAAMESRAGLLKQQSHIPAVAAPVDRGQAMMRVLGVAGARQLTTPQVEALYLERAGAELGGASGEQLAEFAAWLEAGADAEVVDAEVVDAPAQNVWGRIVALGAAGGMGEDQLRADFTTTHGVAPDAATPDQLGAYLALLQDGD